MASPVRKHDNRLLVPTGSHDIQYELDEMTLEVAIGMLKELAQDMIEPKFNLEYGYDGDVSINLVGWREPTEAELKKYHEEQAKIAERVKKQKANDRKLKAEKKAREDLKALERARKAFPEKFREQ